jgi:hypothetical protein
LVREASPEVPQSTKTYLKKHQKQPWKLPLPLATSLTN